jgi:hypothetical protein
MNAIFKNTVFVVWLSLVVCANSFAQEQRFIPELSIGPFVGTTLSKVSFSPKMKESYRTGGIFGVKLLYVTENHLGFLLEPSYCVVGWKENFADYNLADTGTLAYSRSIRYFEFPFMTHIYWGNKYRFFIDMGPVARFLIGDKENYNFSLDDAPGTNGAGYYGVPIDKTFDYGIAGGMGVEFRTGIGSFLLESRYYYGLGDVFNNHKKDYYAKSSNQDIYITLSYLLPLKK